MERLSVPLIPPALFLIIPSIEMEHLLEISFCDFHLTGDRSPDQKSGKRTELMINQLHQVSTAWMCATKSELTTSRPGNICERLKTWAVTYKEEIELFVIVPSILRRLTAAKWFLISVPCQLQARWFYFISINYYVTSCRSEAKKLYKQNICKILDCRFVICIVTL